LEVIMSLVRIHTLVVGAWFIVALVVVTMSVVPGAPVTATQWAGSLALGAIWSVSVMTMLQGAPAGRMAPVVARARRHNLAPAPRSRQ